MAGKARKLGSSRRKMKLQEEADDEKMSIPPQDEEPFSSVLQEKVQEFFQACDGENKGFITRQDMQKANANFLCSPEELEILFDGLDNDCKGYLTTEEFTSGLRQFVQSQDLSSVQRRKRASTKRISVPPRLLELEEADDRERQHFKSFMEHLGANNIFEDESEIWKLWAKLRHDEPYLLGNLEEFLAKVTNQIKEAQREKETLEMTLKKRIAEHNEEVQRLYEEMEQQIHKEKERLRTESDARSNIQSKEMKRTLDFKENDIQHLVVVQNELETQLHNLRSKQQVTNTENEKLKRTNRDLEEQLGRIGGQLLEAQDRIQVMRNKATQQQREEHREQPISKGSHAIHDIQSMSDHQNPITDIKESPAALQPPSRNMQSSRDKDTPPLVVTQTSPDLTEPEEVPRSRVISIEEDPLPDYLTGENTPLQRILSDPGSQTMEDSILEMSPINVYEKIGLQWLDPPLEEDIAVRASRQGRDSEHNSSLEIEGDKPDMLQDALKHTSEKNNDLGHSDQNPISVQGNDHASPVHPTVETAEYIFKKVPNLFKREVNVLIHSPAQPASNFRQNEASEQSFALTNEHDHIAQGAVLSRPQSEDIEDHIEQQPDSEEVIHHDRIIKAAPDTYTLVWDVEPHPVSEQTTQQEKDQKALEESTAVSDDLSTEQDVPHRHMVQERASETSDSANKAKKRVTFTADVLEKLSKAGVENGEEVEEQSTLYDEGESNRINVYGQGDHREKTKKTDATKGMLEGRAFDPTGMAEDILEGQSTPSIPTRINPDHVYKVLFVGNSSVGKSSVLYRIHDGVFRQDIHATIGMDYRIKTLIVDNKCFALQLWDTAGQERYHSITKQFFRKADGIVLMYDVTSTQSFTAVRYWLDCIQEATGDSAVILLLGNKIDCASDRQVSTKEGQQLAERHRLLFRECSAVADINVSQSIIRLARGATLPNAPAHFDHWIKRVDLLKQE
ncbi:ras-related protein Rab-44 isoform X2 [Ambystoma mexicanum]|uniref:ras-related protein Rab-44 isoform X2 n=1 Tax=Ambystoma mexicanum TaxID=8296 RepID=UPI0037E75734